MVWRERGYQYLRCRTCGVVYSDLTAEQYASVQHNVWNEEEPDAEALAFYGAARERVHGEFLALSPPTGDGRLLDVGCGLGFFLERAQARGWDVAGVDTSESWVRLANERLGGDRVVHGLLAEAGLPARSFDLITAWDVIEHIHDPLAFLRDIKELLAPGGRLFLRTPNLPYVYPVYTGRSVVLRDPTGLGATNHIVYFSSATLAKALEAAGLRPVDWLVLPPPQLALSNDPERRFETEGSVSLRAKNTWAGFADRIARSSHGRVCLGSDLDVIATRAGRAFVSDV